MNECEIFDAALKIPEAEARSAFLHQACGDDNQLYERVLERLRVEEDAGGRHTNCSPWLASTFSMPQGSSIAGEPGMMIGPYRLLEQIGKGGFGIVFMAEQREPIRRKVALKIIKPGMDTSEVIARLRPSVRAWHHGPFQYRPGLSRWHDRQRQTVLCDGTGARSVDHRIL